MHGPSRDAHAEAGHGLCRDPCTDASLAQSEQVRRSSLLGQRVSVTLSGLAEPMRAGLVAAYRADGPVTHTGTSAGIHRLSSLLFKVPDNQQVQDCLLSSK